MKIKKPGFFILTILTLVVIFGCPTTTSDNHPTKSESEKAAIVSKAVTESYGTLSTTSKAYEYTISTTATGTTTISDGAGGTLTAQQDTDASGLSGSDYYEDIKNATFVYHLSYDNFHLTVRDSDDNEVQVVLNGSIACALLVSTDTTTEDTTITIVFYGKISGTVDNENFSDYSIDIKYTSTTSGNTASGKIEGTVNGESINETYTVNVSVPST